MKVKKKVLFLAVVLGLVTVFFLSYYINSLAKETIAPQAQVVVAYNTIPANVKITTDMVKLKSVPADTVHPEAITSLDEVVGAVSKDAIIKDEQILSPRIAGNGAGENLSYRIPQNMRAITIPDTETSGVAGNIIVGDKIDILVTYEDLKTNPDPVTITQLQNIEVLSLGVQNQTDQEKKSAIPSSITLLVNPSQAEALAYATIKGTIHITLRNPADSAKISMNYINSSNFASFKER
jgi:pilus assembly protein CpaB